MYVIVALTMCSSYEKRDRFRTLLAPIADTTLQNEPECLAYAWFTSVSENEVPDRYMRGIEVYERPEALAITHRSSEAYKAMRSVMIPEGITEQPTDLRPLKPSGIGFLTRSEGVDDFSSRECQGQILVVRRFSPRDGDGHVAELKTLLRQAADRIDGSVQGSARIRSFWALEYDKALNDRTIVTIERYVDEDALGSTTRLLQDLFSDMQSRCSNVETTRWKSTPGIGFIRGAR